MFAGTELQAQLFYSAVDQAFHSTEALPRDTVACLQEVLPPTTTSPLLPLPQVQEQFHTLAHPPSTAHHLRFSHLVGYGARYYSYLLARAVASAIWQHGFQDDPYCGAAGRRWHTSPCRPPAPHHATLQHHTPHHTTPVVTTPHLTIQH